MNIVDPSYVVSLEARVRDLDGWFEISRQQALQEQQARTKTAKRIRAYRAKYQATTTGFNTDYNDLWNTLVEHEEALKKSRREILRLRLALKRVQSAVTEALIPAS